jgi:hypothetical protein
MIGKIIRGRIFILLIVQALLAFPVLAANSSFYPGFNFYGSGNKCYLKDMNNKVIHTWTTTYQIASHAYLLRDSSVLFPCNDNTNFGDGTWSEVNTLTSGRFQIIKWDGTIVWNFPYHGFTYMPHHDAYPYYYTNDIKELPSIFAIVATKEADNTIAEKIVEIKPIGLETATIKWEWRAYDHRTDDGSDKPELLDINKGGGKGKEWLHANHVRYNPMFDQILLCLKSMNEFIIIDHSTTTLQAASHWGGRYGKGGDILYRWGNPLNYGYSGAQQLFGQHAACWIPPSMPGTRKHLPGAGHVLAINNDKSNGVEMIIPNNNGVYSRLSNTAFGPSAPLWHIDLPAMGTNEGSIQRLPNGNTLICNGISSTGAIEFDANGDSVWAMQMSSGECHRIDSAYLGSTLLDTGKIAATFLNNSERFGPVTKTSLACFATKDIVRLRFPNKIKQKITVAIYAAAGTVLLRKIVSENEFIWKRGNTPAGVYCIKATIDGRVVNQKAILLR